MRDIIRAALVQKVNGSQEEIADTVCFLLHFRSFQDELPLANDTLGQAISEIYTGDTEWDNHKYHEIGQVTHREIHHTKTISFHTLYYATPKQRNAHSQCLRPKSCHQQSHLGSHHPYRACRSDSARLAPVQASL